MRHVSLPLAAENLQKEMYAMYMDSPRDHPGQARFGYGSTLREAQSNDAPVSELSLFFDDPERRAFTNAVQAIIGRPYWSMYVEPIQTSDLVEALLQTTGTLARPTLLVKSDEPWVNIRRNVKDSVRQVLTEIGYPARDAEFELERLYRASEWRNLQRADPIYGGRGVSVYTSRYNYKMLPARSVFTVEV